MSNFEFNKDYILRHKIIFDTDFDEDKYKFGGTYHFKDLSFEKLKKLIELRFADPEDAQNDAPTIKQFYDLVNNHFEQHPEITEYISFHGYVVSHRRDDYRVSIEGLYLNWFGVEIDEFVNEVISLCRHADEFDLDIVKKELYCWFD